MPAVTLQKSTTHRNQNCGVLIAFAADTFAVVTSGLALSLAGSKPSGRQPSGRHPDVEDAVHHHEVHDAERDEELRHRRAVRDRGGVGRVVVRVVPGQQLADTGWRQRAAAEAHDRHAGGQPGPVREPLDQRGHRRDVADAQPDPADHAVAEVEQPQLPVAIPAAPTRKPTTTSRPRRPSPCADLAVHPGAETAARTARASRSRSRRTIPIWVSPVSKCCHQGARGDARRVRLADAQVHRERGRRDEPATGIRGPAIVRSRSRKRQHAGSPLACDRPAPQRGRSDGSRHRYPADDRIRPARRRTAVCCAVNGLVQRLAAAHPPFGWVSRAPLEIDAWAPDAPRHPPPRRRGDPRVSVPHSRWAATTPARRARCHLGGRRRRAHRVRVRRPADGRPDRSGDHRRRHRRPRPAGLRPPRRLRLPARAHARLVRAGHPARCRRDRAGPGHHEGRRAGRPARAGDLRHHRRRRATRSSPAGARPSCLDGVPITGWFTDDFTLAELKTLRAKERHPADPPAQHPLRRALPGPHLPGGPRPGRACPASYAGPSASAPETKHPTYFRALGLPLEPALVRTLSRNGLNRHGARSSCSPSRSAT